MNLMQYMNNIIGTYIIVAYILIIMRNSYGESITIDSKILRLQNGNKNLYVY